jgi:small subunit ribosomal protein S6
MLMPLYECTFITRQDIPVQDANNLAVKFTEIVEKNGGKLRKKEYWGLRSFQYEIKKNKKGHYIMLAIEAMPAVMDELTRNLKINEDVLKYRVMRVAKISDSHSPMMNAPAKATPSSYQDEAAI